MKIREKCAEKKLLKVYFQWNCSAGCSNTIISAGSCSLDLALIADLGWSLHFTLHRPHLLLAITINDRQLKRKLPCQHQLSVQDGGKSREISSLFDLMSFMRGVWACVVWGWALFQNMQMFPHYPVITDVPTRCSPAPLSLTLTNLCKVFMTPTH